MSYLLGIDIGTSGTKSVVMDESGTVQGSALYEYDIDTPNPIAPGFMAATLLWIKAHQPKTFEALHKIVLPKDYVRFRLCGEIATDASDAAGTLLFDVRHRCWAAELLDRLGIPRDLLPKVNDSTDIIGQVSTQAAAETGLTAGTPVIAGGADQPVAALGNGVIKEGLVLSTIGTGLFNSPEEACDRIISYSRTTHPIPENCDRYNELYEIYKGLYPKLKEDFGKIAQKFPYKYNCFSRSYECIGF